MKNLNSFKTLSTLEVEGKLFHYHNLKKLLETRRRKLPYSIQILLENLLRYEDNKTVKAEDIESVLNWSPEKPSQSEIQFRPSRVLLQDLTGVPAVVDLAAMRSSLKRLGGDPQKINPLQPADLVIDHSVQVDTFGNAEAFGKNVELEFSRNKERYQFLKWGQKAFKNFRVVPPGTGICHQVNLEYLAQVARVDQRDGESWIFPDTVVGTDSHTTMINGLGVLGWGVGGIEAEAALLGQPCSMLIPEVIGFQMKGKLQPGVTATDLVLTVTQMLRKRGVVGKFVEFFGSGLGSLTLADRATIANMAPEYGATVGLFPIDTLTLNYLKLTGRNQAAQLVQAYAQAQGFLDTQCDETLFSDHLELDLSTVRPSLAGPARPQDRVELSQARKSFRVFMKEFSKETTSLEAWIDDSKAHFTKRDALPEYAPHHPDEGISSFLAKRSKHSEFYLSHGSIVIAAITSCTNTSNPNVMIGAGLLAKKALALGLQVRPWVKTSLAPGSQVVTEYLRASHLLEPLEKLGFNLVGYGCTTCIGNSGPLPEEISDSILKSDLAVVSVLSGNRNFEGRINTQIRANYLMSPPLVVAYALAGNIQVDLQKEPVGFDRSGKGVFLKDIWPQDHEIEECIQKYLSSDLFQKGYSDVFEGTGNWKELPVPQGELFAWEHDSSYVRETPFFKSIDAHNLRLDQTLSPQSIQNARVLAMLGDSITTDHISPAGSIGKSTPAGKYLISLGTKPQDFNSYGARRGNHEVMVRGTFANVRLKNKLVPGVEGGVTLHFPTQQSMSIFEASELYQKEKIPLVILAGKEYGTGSSRDWAAKGTKLLGVQIVLAESFERIHRSNLVGMGILPLQYLPGSNAQNLGLQGDEFFSVQLYGLKPQSHLKLQVQKKNGETKEIECLCRIDTINELDYYHQGGILNFVLKQFVPN